MTMGRQNLKTLVTSRLLRRVQPRVVCLPNVANPSSDINLIPLGHLLNKNAQELAEDSHLDPPEHAYDFEDDTWEGEFEDGTWDEDGAEKDDENAQSRSNESSVTLSSKASKRSFDEFELDDEGYADESGIYGTPPSSPGE